MEITVAALGKAFAREGYIADDEVLLTVYLALKLEKPLLVEGEPGVGKTELAKVLARVFQTELIRLQCYEGLDENKALYEWNYQRQLLKIQLARETGCPAELEEDIFSEDYLLARPLLKALQAPEKVVLLIDEVDKTDEEFEAFLYEVLADFQVSVPELGTLRARHIPMVVLTSNNERELSDGLKRRCLYLYLTYPPVEREVEIIRTRVPALPEKFAWQLARAVAHIRALPEINKKPSLAETLDWAEALLALGKEDLDQEAVEQTLNLLLKRKADQDAFAQHLGAARLAGLSETESC